jgi:hypothetical protein
MGTDTRRRRERYRMWTALFGGLVMGILFPLMVYTLYGFGRRPGNPSFWNVFASRVEYLRLWQGVGVGLFVDGLVRAGDILVERWRGARKAGSDLPPDGNGGG